MRKKRMIIEEMGEVNIKYLEVKVTAQNDWNNYDCIS